MHERICIGISVHIHLDTTKFCFCGTIFLAVWAAKTQIISLPLSMICVSRAVSFGIWECQLSFWAWINAVTASLGQYARVSSSAGNTTPNGPYYISAVLCWDMPRDPHNPHTHTHIVVLHSAYHKLMHQSAGFCLQHLFLQNIGCFFLHSCLMGSNKRLNAHNYWAVLLTNAWEWSYANSEFRRYCGVIKYFSVFLYAMQFFCSQT